MTTSSSPSDPLHGLNPEQLLEIAADFACDADTVLSPRSDLPSLEEVAAAFPDLEIQELIGRGGMSAVFRARQPRLGRVVALKVLPKSLAALPGFAERFTREGQVLARLSHPQIVTVHDFGERNGFWFLIMEHVDGVNLRQAMRAGRFTPEQALEVIPAICDALQFAHGQGVLHRDIKPENILLDSKGGIKIADFGIAKILGEEAEGGMLLTQSGAKLGTAAYMAPEQVEKPASVDHRADIYSLGVVFYEMLTGELPLGRFAAPSELAGVGGGIDAVVLRALEKERTRRQQSAEEFKTQVAGAGSSCRTHRKLRFGDPFEYRSKRTLCGLPLLHVVSGPDPETGQVRVAHGFFAVGERARGVFAFGGYARGWFAFGGLAVGLIAFGGLGIGLISFSGIAIGLLLSIGGFSLGTLSMGGFALGYHAAGGFAMGWHAIGGQVFAHQGYGGLVKAEEVVRDLQLMPRPTRALFSWNSASYVLGALWVPVSAFFWCAQIWGREQAEIEAGGDPKHGPSSKLFLMVPAVVFTCLALAWEIFALSRLNSGLTVWLLIPSLVTELGLILFIAALPLWLRMVPMNSLWGLRLSYTLSSEQRWYDANAQFGKSLLGWSIVITLAGLVGFHQLPRHQDVYPWAVLFCTLSGLACVCVSIWWWLRHHPVDGAVKNESYLAKLVGKTIIAVVLVFFIKSFILESYRIAGGGEAGVTKGSHWISCRLDTGFDPNDLVVYEHERGNPFIGRVVKKADKGLVLKRGGVEGEFFVEWDRIIGKLLFSHFTPDALKP